MMDAALRVVARCVGLLPSRVLAPLGAVVGWVFGSLVRVRRSLVEIGMTRAGVADPARTASSMYRGLGRGVVELLWVAGVSPRRRDAMLAQVTIEDDAAQALDDAMARGPVILFASHTGNWELAAAAAARRLAERGRRLAVVAKPIRSRGVQRFTAELREALGVHVIPADGAFAAARRALAAGDVVVMPIDQVPDRASHAASVPFLGAVALVDRAPATLAWRSRATILVVAADRGRALQRIRLLGRVAPRPAVVTGGQGRAAHAWIDHAARLSTGLLEAFVRSAPASWLWLHRRWNPPRVRARRPGPARLVVARKAG